MKDSLLVALILTALLLPCAAKDGGKGTVPVEFLRTDLKPWREILDKEITADFKESSLGEVVSFLAIKTQANIVLEISGGGPIPGLEGPSGDKPVAPLMFTGNFKHTPLRLVLYRLSRDTHLVVDWFYLPEHPLSPQAISIHSK